MKNGYENLKRINCLGNEMDRLYHQAALKLGVSDSVLCVLYVIHEKGDSCPLSDICAGSGISKQTINSALRNLEREGILYLEPDKGRSKRVRLTEKGRDFTARTAARLYEAECRAFDQWTEQELAQYLFLMEKYNNSFRVQVENMDTRP